MLRVQPTQELAALEKETLANMKRDGLRDTQFIKSDPGDRQRAADYGWEGKLLDFNIPDDPNEATFEAVLDSLAGFTRCSNACAFSQKVAEQEGVVFKFGHQAGGIASLMEEVTPAGKKKATGLKTRDGNTHTADVIVIAGECHVPAAFKLEAS